jgi:hypothetical protein
MKGITKSYDMKFISLAISMLVLLVLSIRCGAKDTLHPTPAKKPFNVYGFIVYAGYSQDGKNVSTSYQQLQQYLLPYGIKKLNLFYEGKMLDYPNGDKSNGVPSIKRIDSLGYIAKNDPDIPVSLDLEGWSRFDTIKTPGRMIAVIDEFKNANRSSKVGLYATVPQNTYGYDSTIHKYDKFNKAYSSVAASVDYFSPSLYNYKDSDTIAWNKAADYNINACKLYQFPDKQILPYITPEVKRNGVTTLLSYDEMMSHLNTLYKLGADGCLIWTSSSTRDVNGNKIYIDVNTGWIKAVKDFIVSHQ